MVLNEPFALFASVTLQSIVDFSTQKMNYDVFVCTDKDFSSVTKSLLLSQISGLENFSLRFLNLSDYLDIADFNNKNITYPTIVFGRLFLPFILSDYEKIVYMDSDMIVNSDISGTYGIDLGKSCIAGVRDLVMVAWCQDEKHFAHKHLIGNLKIENIEDYINSGFLIFNVREYNKFISPENIMAFEKENKLLWPDQDLINKVFTDRILFLDNSYNVLCAARDDENTIQETGRTDLLDKFRNSFKNPKIIHFLNCSFLITKFPVRFFDSYWRIAKKSPYYETLIFKSIERQFSNQNNLEALLEQASMKKCLRILLRRMFRPVARMWRKER